ncbi:MAG: winged helix-turn-helix transcriptional regulator [Gammaproteobacteria bacterium]|nr:winged helix-turn-helix transcriptional regulator [Gammaproteobacteria bacterium]MCP4879746.1 winged helix-turn-helix transcriptional regulator [Gammaproteobacteria bacterium]
MESNLGQKKFELSTYFPYLVRIFGQQVSGSVKNVYETECGLSVSEWRTLAVLNEMAPLSAKNIVMHSSMNKVKVSRAVASLIKREYIESHIDPADQRCNLIRLTRKGRRIMEHLIPMVKKLEEELLDGISIEEYQLLLRLMQKIRTNAELAINNSKFNDEGEK